MKDKLQELGAEDDIDPIWEEYFQYVIEKKWLVTPHVCSGGRKSISESCPVCKRLRSVSESMWINDVRILSFMTNININTVVTTFSSYEDTKKRLCKM